MGGGGNEKRESVKGTGRTRKDKKKENRIKRVKLVLRNRKF
jgi:hypothetical protein